jgi:uncharacterized DUF497 family protein
VRITWDPDKASANLIKHGVDFYNAATVFTDPLSTTFASEDHSERQARFLTIGEAVGGELLVVAHTEEGEIIRIISARRTTPRERRFMKKGTHLKDEMRAEYDFVSMRRGVRGKYVERLRRESNIVVLEPEVAAPFPTGDSVNAALRGMLDTARTVRRHGGLPNTALQPKRAAAKERRVPSARKTRSPRRG